jgi:hypothetical protein
VGHSDYGDSAFGAGCAEWQVRQSGEPRVWLRGPREGRVEPFLDDLPGFPDNIATGTDGLIWITQASPRMAALDVVRRLPRVVRAGVRALPQRLQPGLGREVGVLGVAADGTVAHELRGEIDGFHMLVGVREWRGKLYFGSLVESAIAITIVHG